MICTLSKRGIIQSERVSIDFVLHWTQSPHQDMTIDHRGWPKGKRRHWTKQAEVRIKRLHTQLTQDSKTFFTGATALADEWRKHYPDTSPPPLRTIGRILKSLGVSGTRKKGKNKGAARYLCYPEYTIYEGLGGRVIEADFVGKKFITGRTAPLHFAGFSSKKPPKVRWFKRGEAETADGLIAAGKEFFARYETPDYLKVDNGSAMSGSALGKRNISKTMAFLLKHKIIPIFSVPKRPFSQAAIEGNNSVFARFFWNKRRFRSLKDVDSQLEWFNDAARQYYHYQQSTKQKPQKKEFVPKAYFIRQVQEDQTRKRMNGYIDV